MIMHETFTIHAIQHRNAKGFSARYRPYASKKERDETFKIISKYRDPVLDPIEKVTLTITAVTASEQLEMEL